MVANRSRTAVRLAAGVLLLVATRIALASPDQGGQALTFRSAIDLVALDVQILDRDGHPLAGLGADDFQVWFNGRPRRVASVDLVRYPVSLSGRPPISSLNPTVMPDMPPDVTGRVIVIAVDEASLSLASARQAMNAAKAFVRQLAPEDVVGVYAFPFGSAKVDLQHDRIATSLKLDRVTGRYFKPSSQYTITLSEMVDITSGNQVAFDEVVDRECNQNIVTDALSLQSCRRGVYLDAYTTAAYYETQYAQSLGDLRALIEGLGTVAGRKTLILVSGGLAVADRTGGHPDVTAMLQGTVASASEADVSLYALHIDTGLAEAFSPAAKPRVGIPGAQKGVEIGGNVIARNQSLGRDLWTASSGLERLAGDSGGAIFRDQVGAGERGFARILTETTAYYLLGVESLDADRDGRTHYIRVKANVKNATVRARTQVIIPRARK